MKLLIPLSLFLFFINANSALHAQTEHASPRFVAFSIGLGPLDIVNASQTTLNPNAESILTYPKDIKKSLLGSFEAGFYYQGKKNPKRTRGWNLRVDYGTGKNELLTYQDTFLNNNFFNTSGSLIYKDQAIFVSKEPFEKFSYFQSEIGYSSYFNTKFNSGKFNFLFGPNFILGYSNLNYTLIDNATQLPLVENYENILSGINLDLIASYSIASQLRIFVKTTSDFVSMDYTTQKIGEEKFSEANFNMDLKLDVFKIGIQMDLNNAKNEN